MAENPLNVAVIGHSLHGKSTLAALLANRLAERYPALNRPQPWLYPPRRNHAELRALKPLAAPGRRLTCLDCPGHGWQADLGFHTADLALLVVDVGRGVEERTIEHALLAR